MAKLLLFCAILMPYTALAASPIARFVFVTEPQVVPAGELSGDITVQAQNAAGDTQQSDETIDLAFSSTSATGGFLSASGEPVKTTMNRGTANRTFYYRDASAGTHTLAITAVGRVSGQSWTVSQRIAVGAQESAERVGLPSGATELVAGRGDTEEGIVPQRRATSAAERLTIEARAGADRTVIAGAPVAFDGGAIGLLKEPIENARFWWNFGDGATGEGKVVSHAFQAPGTYISGLHVSSGMYAASDYIIVTVIPNKVAVTEVVEGEKGFIRMQNGSEQTVDIGGWIMEEATGKKFIFPPHTMVRGTGDIALSRAVTGLAGTPPLTVRFPDGSAAFVYAPVPAVPARDTPASVPIVPAVAAVSFAGAETARIKTDAAREQKRPTPTVGTGASSSPLYAASVSTAASPSRFGGYAFLGLAALVSAGASAGFLFLRKFLF